MAPKLAVISPRSKRIELWTRFQSTARKRVEEGNLVAQQRLWHIGESLETPLAFTIRSTVDPSGWLECSLDADAGVVTCQPSPFINTDAIRFRLTGRETNALQHETGPCSLEHAVTLILDELVGLEFRAEHSN